jgi:RNA polymerase-binding transcription factor DksA
MDPIRPDKHLEQLRLRRNQVAFTLSHVEKERREVEQNTDWLDQASHESRIALIDQLSARYIHEIEDIDKALDRLKNNTYGICLACHSAIEAPRLDSFPEAAFCSGCQETREGLQNI